MPDTWDQINERWGDPFVPARVEAALYYQPNEEGGEDLFLGLGFMAEASDTVPESHIWIDWESWTDLVVEVERTRREYNGRSRKDQPDDNRT